MTTLVIKNKGLIEPGDLTLIGSSTKRGDNTKIGMYGSGNKYSLAWFLRNNIDIRIFSGTKEIELSHEIVKHRERDVAVLTVDREKTSITSEMGPEWTGWMALREIISNAIDEGDFTITSAFNIQVEGEANVTSLFIPLNNELNKVVMNYDSYFAFDRKPSFECNVGRIYVNTTPDIQNIYRKGIKCFNESSNLKKYLDYDFNSIPISESRVCDAYDKDCFIEKMVEKITDPAILKLAIIDGVLPSHFNSNLVAPMTKLIEQGEKFTSKKMVKLLGQLFTSDDALIIPDDWYKELMDRKLLDNPFKFNDFDFVEDLSRKTSGIKYYLMSLGFEGIDVFAGKFDSYNEIACNKDYTVFYLNSSLAGHEDKNIASMIIKKLPTDLLANTLF